MTRVDRLLAPRRVALVLGLSIAALALLGALEAWSPLPALTTFDLDGERNVPAVFSSLLLVASAALALRLPPAIVARPVAVVFGGILLLGSLDEAVEIHERLESRLGVDWQVLYAPVFVLAAVVWVSIVVRVRRDRVAFPLMLVSGACWVVSQVFEKLQWDDDGPAPGYTWMMFCEEILEMTGSGLLLLALLIIGRAERGEP